jgi:hypothetical protein
MSVNPFIDTYDLGISAEEAAKKIGCKVVKPEPHQLQLDIDSEDAYDVYKKRIMEFERHSNYIIRVEEHPSKSGLPKRHITLDVYEKDGQTPHIFDEYERIALHVALGSDVIRETLNVWRLIRGCENPSRLFEPLDA